MAAGVAGAELVHSHTWYANLGGHLAKLVHGIPHVATVHSLEPMRPWKQEQLGGGYALSSFAERTALEAADAIVAVSAAHLAEILTCYPAVDPARTSVIYNGIDAEEYRPDRGTDVLERHGIDPDRPSVVFVGRITRQKGLVHLLEAAPAIDPEAQLVLCAGAPDTPEIALETAARMEAVRQCARQRDLDRGDAAEAGRDPDPQPCDRVRLPVGLRADGDRQPRGDGLRGCRRRDRGRRHPRGRRGRRHRVARPLRGATGRNGNAGRPGCPSVYEPMGIVNLEAMACEAAVVATAVGGIPEVVEDGVTGLLVPYEAVADGTGTPADPTALATALAGRVNELLADPARAEAMGRAGRVRAAERFGWDVAAAETLRLYERLLT